VSEHQRYSELGALALSGTLSPGEWAELRSHLQVCDSCREICRQYELIRNSVPLLAAEYTPLEDLAWDDAAARRRLFDRIQGEQPSPIAKILRSFGLRRPKWLQPSWAIPAWTRAALAACLFVAMTAGAYHLGTTHGTRLPLSSESGLQVHLQELAQQKQAADALVAMGNLKISQLSDHGSALQKEIQGLRSQVLALQAQATELASGKKDAAQRAQNLAQERDVLISQLRASVDAYQKIQAELVSLRAERESAILRATSLETRVNELTALNREQEHKLKSAEGYLESDRDIRELMGARRLYIADVFDVDSGSRTQKPFGRVFYTENKSLIFYAFDLDQPGIKSASTFQVWGRKEAPQGEEARALNLGILYMDNTSNRRWVMRSDDPKQLAEIDAIFVTVEPHGGSNKPSSKPFLYALLRNAANHP